MSVQALSWVLEHSDAEGSDRLVLISLADHARADGSSAWPSAATLTRHTRLGERTVRRSLAALEAAGRIIRTGVSPGQTVVWRVVMTLPETAADPCQSGTPAKLAPLPDTTETPANLAPNPSITRQEHSPPNPPNGGNGERRTRRQTKRDRELDRMRHTGIADDAPLDDFTRAAYARIGVTFPADATMSDARAHDDAAQPRDTETETA